MLGIYGACPMDLRKTLIYDSILRCIRIIIIVVAETTAAVPVYVKLRLAEDMKVFLSMLIAAGTKLLIVI